MFIDAAQISQVKAPSDAGSVAIETAIRQQKQFEEALQRAQDRREAEAAAAERAKAEARKDNAPMEALDSGDQIGPDGSTGGDALDANAINGGRGVSVDVEV